MTRRALLALAAVAGLSVLPGSGLLVAQEEQPVVVVKTTQGDIVIELDAAKAPITVKNFLEYADSGFYGETLFHRVIDGFMIQGGGMTADMKEKATREPIKNESSNGLSNARGTIAMARTNDPDSATAQFFINLVDNSKLDTYGGGYAVFGKVIEGMDVVDKIAKCQTISKSGHRDVPKEPIVIKSVERRTKP